MDRVFRSPIKTNRYGNVDIRSNNPYKHVQRVAEGIPRAKAMVGFDKIGGGKYRPNFDGYVIDPRNANENSWRLKGRCLLDPYPDAHLGELKIELEPYRSRLNMLNTSLQSRTLPSFASDVELNRNPYCVGGIKLFGVCPIYLAYADICMGFILQVDIDQARRVLSHPLAHVQDLAGMPNGSMWDCFRYICRDCRVDEPALRDVVDWRIEMGRIFEYLGASSEAIAGDLKALEADDFEITVAIDPNDRSVRSGGCNPSRRYFSSQFTALNNCQEYPFEKALANDSKVKAWFRDRIRGAASNLATSDIPSVWPDLPDLPCTLSLIHETVAAYLESTRSTATAERLKIQNLQLPTRCKFPADLRRLFCEGELDDDCVRSLLEALEVMRCVATIHVKALDEVNVTLRAPKGFAKIIQNRRQTYTVDEFIENKAIIKSKLASQHTKYMRAVPWYEGITRTEGLSCEFDDSGNLEVQSVPKPEWHIHLQQTIEDDDTYDSLIRTWSWAETQVGVWKNRLSTELPALYRALYQNSGNSRGPQYTVSPVRYPYQLIKHTETLIYNRELDDHKLDTVVTTVLNAMNILHRLNIQQLDWGSPAESLFIRRGLSQHKLITNVPPEVMERIVQNMSADEIYNAPTQWMELWLQRSHNDRSNGVLHRRR